MTKTDKFLQVISNLPESKLELDSFWHCVAEQAKRLHTKDPLRDKLCQAVAELQMNQTRPRSPTIGFRSLSGDQLNKAVLKHREYLIRFIDECYNWKAMMATWILNTRQGQLVKVLNALGCSHNGKGSRRGNPPELAPDEAMRQIVALSSEISFDDLAVVVAGLISNHKDWSYLESTLEHIQKEAQRLRLREVDAQLVAKNSEPELTRTSEMDDDSIARIQDLHGLMDALIGKLEGAVTALQAGRLPDIATITNAMDFLQVEFADLVNKLQPEYQSLE